MKKQQRQQILEKYGNRCAYCGEDIDLKSMQVDHIRSQRNFYFGRRSEIPDYDVHSIQNLNPSCRKCNNFKTGMGLEEFRNELQKQVERARLRSVNFRMAEKFGQIQVNEKPIRFYFEKL